LQAVVQHLEELLAAAENRHDTRQTIQILAHLSLAYENEGRRDEAMLVLERALALARPGSFIRTFVDLGPEMACLLHQLAERDLESEYIGRILAAFPDTLDAAGFRDEIRQAAQAKLDEPLSERELEVLELLSEQRSDKEIAQALSISVWTARTHARNIYQKLGVTGRKRAVAQAKTLGILSSD
jgi:LuxR family maltose regulon positive regulatory protein